MEYMSIIRNHSTIKPLLLSSHFALILEHSLYTRKIKYEKRASEALLPPNATSNKTKYDVMALI